MVLSNTEDEVSMPALNGDDSPATTSPFSSSSSFPTLASLSLTSPSSSSSSVITTTAGTIDVYFYCSNMNHQPTKYANGRTYSCDMCGPSEQGNGLFYCMECEAHQYPKRHFAAKHIYGHAKNKHFGGGETSNKINRMFAGENVAVYERIKQYMSGVPEKCHKKEGDGRCGKRLNSSQRLVDKQTGVGPIRNKKRYLNPQGAPSIPDLPAPVIPLSLDPVSSPQLSVPLDFGNHLSKAQTSDQTGQFLAPLLRSVSSSCDSAISPSCSGNRLKLQKFPSRDLNAQNATIAGAPADPRAVFQFWASLIKLGALKSLVRHNLILKMNQQSVTGWTMEKLFYHFWGYARRVLLEELVGELNELSFRVPELLRDNVSALGEQFGNITTKICQNLDWSNSWVLFVVGDLLMFGRTTHIQCNPKQVLTDVWQMLNLPGAPVYESEKVLEVLNNWCSQYGAGLSADVLQTIKQNNIKELVAW